MLWLVIETFILMSVAVAVGIAAGAVLRGIVGGGSSRPVLAGAGGPAVVAEHHPVAPPSVTVPASPPAEPPPADTAPVDLPAARPTAADAIVDPVRAAGADQVGVRPAVLSGPRDARRDDLKLIKGIGPQNEARLNGLGIYHFDQIAAWTPEEARWVGTYLAFPGRIEREDWIGQAKTLAG